MKVMALSSLKFNSLIATNTTKFLIPFILKSNYYISKEPFEFVNAYIGDTNRPWLDNKIFLVFKTNRTLNTIRKKLEENEHFYSTYWITINDESYDIFTYNIPFEYKKQISFIKEGFVTSIDVSSKKRILDFWSKNEYDVFSTIFNYNSTTKTVDLSNDLIREEDIVLSTIDTMLGIA